MSFWDVSFTTSSPGTPTPPPQVSGQPSPTLNEEVTEVIGQLGRFWGGFRKQGQSAIQAARKDLGDYVSQAQKGLNTQLSTTLSASSPAPAADTDAQSSTASSSRDLIDLTTADGESSSASSSASASTATLPDPQQQQQRPDQAQSPNAQTLLTRLQSSIPPDLLTSLRDTIPDSVRDAQARRELAHVAQARVQGAAARGEELLRGASVFLRDAVRVVPPEEAASSSSSSAFVAPSAHEGTPTPPHGKAASPPVVVSSTPATRRGILLRALREHPAILRVDPAKEERSAALFASWVEVVGAEASRDESHRESELGADDGTLRSTRSVLVPGELSEDEFWTRYFFRVHQIDQEEERRKAVLAAGPTDQDDDFSWEDEDEDAAPKAEASPTPTLSVLNRDKLLGVADASGTMSPQRSDDSFDLVSSGHTSAAHVSAEGTSDGDEDEDDEDEGVEDEDEDEDEEESDWE